MNSENINNNEWKVNIDDYYGPLSVLLDIIHKNHMVILKFNLSEITSQYVNFVNGLISKAITQKELDNLSEYLYTAQYLISLKARYLVKRESEINNLEISQDVLASNFTNLLLLVQKYKDAIIELSNKQNERILMFSKKNSKFESFIPDDFNYERLPSRIDSSIFLKYLEEFEDLNSNLEPIVKDYKILDIPVNEVIKRIINYLKEEKKSEFSVMFKVFYSQEKFGKYYLVTLFLACLILYNEQKINIEQIDNELLLIYKE